MRRALGMRAARARSCKWRRPHISLRAGTVMNAVKEVNAFGVGRVSRRAAAEAAHRHPDVCFRLFAREPRRYPPSRLANVRFFRPEQLKDDGTPLVLCMASDESRILREHQHRGTAVFPRSAVAAANLRLLR